jgi:hypothetical protein
MTNGAQILSPLEFPRALTKPGRATNTECGSLDKQCANAVDLAYWVSRGPRECKKPTSTWLQKATGKKKKYICRYL